MTIIYPKLMINSTIRKTEVGEDPKAPTNDTHLALHQSARQQVSTEIHKATSASL